MEKEEAKKKIRAVLSEYFSQMDEKFVPGTTPIYTGKAVYDDKEIGAITDTLIDGWFGLGRRGTAFEMQFARYVERKYGIVVNSGSSANLIALDTIKNKLNLKGGEIISPACAFPTTINPSLQLGFRPAVIDVDDTFNITPEAVSAAITPNTKGIMFAHTLGNPAQIEEIAKIAKENNLFLVEDCCDALGSKYAGKHCGSWGDCATYSFYPAHIITAGEGGAVTTNDQPSSRIARSLRDWGRDCWCNTDEKNIMGTCGRRFDFKLTNGELYDHKFMFSRIGYNLKPLELQAAMLIEQMSKLDEFIKLRKRNYKIYSEEMQQFDKYITLPRVNDKADPVFFGLPMLLNQEKAKRQDLLKFLNKSQINTRLLFSGNLLYHPAYKDLQYTKYQELTQTDRIMRDCFWIGVHPGVTEEMIKFVMGKFKEYFATLK